MTPEVTRGGVRVFIDGVGVLGPGLAGWPAAQRAFSIGISCNADPVLLPQVAALPPAERRRTGTVVRLAVAVGLEALAHARLAAADTASVFASSGGDSETINAILEVLATDQRDVSPTRFHNSVHNAPSGYWAVACAARAPSTSICAYDGSFAAGLLDAAVQAVVEARPVALIAYDLPYPEPLHSIRPIGGIFGAALVLSPIQGPSSLACLHIAQIAEDLPPTGMENPVLEALRQTNPAARALPLLTALARNLPATLRIAGLEGSQLAIDIAPC